MLVSEVFKRLGKFVSEVVRVVFKGGVSLFQKYGKLFLIVGRVCFRGKRIISK